MLFYVDDCVLCDCFSSLICASCLVVITVIRCVELDRNEPSTWSNNTRPSKLLLNISILRYSPLSGLCWCYLYHTCICSVLLHRHDICQHNYAVFVSFCGQPRYCYRPYYLTARFPSPLSYMVSDEPFLDRSRPMSCLLAQVRSRPIAFLWLLPATNHQPHCQHVPINKIWGWTEFTSWSRWQCSHMAGIYSDCSTREIITVIIRWNSTFCCLSLCLWFYIVSDWLLTFAGNWSLISWSFRAFGCGCIWK